MKQSNFIGFKFEYLDTEFFVFLPNSKASILVQPWICQEEPAF